MSVEQTSHIEVNGFGFLPDNPQEIIRRYTLTNKNNAYVRLISLGAGIQSITLPNKNGDMADVVLGFDNVIGYLKNRYIGRIVGRVLNPLTKLSRSYVAEKNSDDRCSFDIVNWNSYILGKQVVMTHLSRDCSEGYPGDLLTQVKYTWTDNNQLHVDISAMSTKPTPVNVSSYCLFNLAGHNMGAKELKCHIAAINADNWTQLNIVEGTSAYSIGKVHEAIYSLRYPTRLSKKKLYKLPGGGYNHNTCINSSISTWYYRFHARMFHPSTGRFLEVYSNHPTLYLYTGNDLPNPEKTNPPDIENYENTERIVNKLEERMIGKHGIPYKRHGCFALIPQGYPKTLNCGNYPLNILYPGKIYSHNITYKFGIVT